MTCPYCGKTFTPRNCQQKTCGSGACKKARKRAHRQTDECKAYERAYLRAYQKTDEYKAYDRARRQTEEYRAYQRARNQTEKRKAYQRARNQTDEYKAYNRAYQRARRTAEALGIPPLLFVAMKITSQLQEPNHDTRQRTA